MNCPSCKTEMVLARATSFGEPYQYCRSCKRELVEIRAAMTPTEAWGSAIPDYSVDHSNGCVTIRTGFRLTPHQRAYGTLGRSPDGVHRMIRDNSGSLFCGHCGLDPQSLSGPVPDCT